MVITTRIFTSLVSLPTIDYCLRGGGCLEKLLTGVALCVCVSFTQGHGTAQADQGAVGGENRHMVPGAQDHTQVRRGPAPPSLGSLTILLILFSDTPLPLCH